MWTCPSCGRSFANANQWHSCGNPALEEVLGPHSEAAVALYRAVEAAMREAGEHRIHPQKTRIAFISRMTFASVRLARRWADVSFILPEPVDHPRIRRIDLYGPTSFGHEVRIEKIAEVDDDLREWLAEALRRGNQESLDPSARVEPLVGRPLELVTVPLRVTVEKRNDRFGFRIPRYAADAFDAYRQIDVRVARQHLRGVLERDARGDHVRFDGQGILEAGLGDGDETDAFLAADL